MERTPRFVGREAERAEIARHFVEAESGRGGLVLVAGEAGVGKTRLVREALGEVIGGVAVGSVPGMLADRDIAGSVPSGRPADGDAGGRPASVQAAHRDTAARLLAGAATHFDASPFGPIVQALRSHLRAVGAGDAVLGPLAGHLAVLLPELGVPAESGDRATLHEAIRQAFAGIAASGATAVFLDDLHWADDATLELLPDLAASLDGERLLFLCAYRGDEIPRGHPLRRMRAELRRGNRLREIALEPLGPDETTGLAVEILGSPVSGPLAAMLQDRSQGVPFFLEELAAALGEGGHLRQGPDGLELVPGREVPVPESIREAVILRLDGLGAGSRAALEAAAVVGVRFDPGLVVELFGGDDALIEPFERALLVEAGDGQAAFRHALAREALYHEIPWPRRRSLHGEIARRLESRGAPPDALAAHWLAAREFDAARRALIESAEASCHVHAYRDAMRTARRALELWAEGEDEAMRLAVLDRLGRCAELSGDLAEAVRAWSEVAEARKRSGNLYEYGDIQRRIGSAFGLQGSWDRAVTAHLEAAGAFVAHGLPGEAAAERLAAAEYLHASGSSAAALELVRQAAADAERAGSADLHLLALGFEGQLRTETGDTETGLAAIRSSLELALARGLRGPAAELHYRLAWALGESSDYASARNAFQAGIDFCQANGVEHVEQQCIACYAGVLVEVGEWQRASEICHEVRKAEHTIPVIRTVATVILGVLEGLRGRQRPARRLLQEAEARTREHPIAGVELSTSWGFAIADELDGDVPAGAGRIRAILDRWEATDDLYYIVHPLRWAVTFLARNGRGAEARACADALATVAARKGSPETLAALAHALGECALLEGDAGLACDHFDNALGILKRIGMPFQHAHTEVRAAAALSAAGNRDAAVEAYVDAYRTARRMGAAALATWAAEGLRALGEPVERRLGRRAVRHLDRAGLTRRELQVLRLVNAGMSNREIARDLFLSPRTVEMHVGNALLKLGCSTRTEAARRARELGVIA